MRARWSWDRWPSALRQGRSVSDITVASVSITGDDGSSQTLTLSQTVLTAALSSEGYTESAPDLFASMIFNTANNYTITFTIGDAYDRAVFSILIARSFANMHLSGVPDGRRGLWQVLQRSAGSAAV